MVHIDSVKFGEITVDGKTYYSDLVVFWDGSLSMRPKSHVFGVEELVRVLERNPDSVVIGTGISGILKITDDARELAETKGVKFFMDVSENACDIFNGLVKEGKKAAAVIHTTC